MPFSAPNPNRLWADLIVEELVRSGVTRFYIAPGSRSTPLVTAVADHPDATTDVHYDERGTAFMALGYGRATGRAAAWITTSGTALANGLPAVVEAHLEHIPMVLLTADRPPELRDTGANQTITQPGIFEPYVRWQVDLPAPDTSLDPAYVLTTIDQAVARSRSGPVHVNCMYREPLAPERVPHDPVRGHRAFERWQQRNQPYTTYGSGYGDPAAVAAGIDALIRGAERPVILLGRMDGADILRKAIDSTPDIKAMNVPIMADISSQVRLGAGGYPFIPAWDAILYNKGIYDKIEPDLVVQFGRAPVSKRLQQFLEAAGPADWVVVAEGEERVDPRHRVTRRETGVPEQVFGALLARRTREAPAESSVTHEWISVWKGLSRAVGDWRKDVLDSPTFLTEQIAASVLSESIPASTFLSLGSSTPVRHMDIFASMTGPRVPVCANRGASGIDGTFATAAGYADGSARRPVIFLGDLAGLHDLNSLRLAAARKAVIVLINNDGGGIFSYLPIRRHEDVFEEYFGTPHGIEFQHGAAMFGLRYERPERVDAFVSVLHDAFNADAGTLIEIRTERKENYEEQRRLLVALSDRTTSALKQAGVA